MRSALALTLALALAGCSFEDPAPTAADAPWLNGDGEPYCWVFECPFDIGATECGTCTDPLVDEQCPPGFICTCARTCIKGPRNADAQPGCLPDAAMPDAPPADAAPGPDAAPPPDALEYDWPACDMGPIPP
jgi:hypothetical protein